ncbi:MAG TPA: hypothetical protein VKB18_03545 [Gemmatimonadota bacterium]|nr:hypothetical protein [Gemmatimonadota bacterium]
MRRSWIRAAAFLLAAGIPAAGAAAPRAAPRTDGPALRRAGASAARPDTAPDSARAAPTELARDLLRAFEYRFIGPSNPSGRVTALAVPDSAGHRMAYAGLASGGVWKTTNAGTTWTSVFDHEGSPSVGDIAVAPWNHDVVWVGTGERNSLRSQTWGDGVYRSADGGKTWKNMGLKETREIGRIAIDPADSGVVYVAALGHLWGPDPERGVYRTVDAGKTWKKILFVDDTTGFIDLEIDPKHPKTLFAAGWHRLRWGGGKMEGAGAGSGIWRTRDGGDTWTRLTAPGNDRGLPSEKLGRIGLAIYPRSPNVVYAVIQVAHGAKDPSVSPFGGLFRSDDGGDSWDRINDLSAVPDYYYDEVWVDPSDSTNVYLGATRLFHSTDGGRSFSPVRYRNVHVDNHALWFDPDDSRHMLLGNDGGVYQSYDAGETWAHQIIPASQFYEVDVDTTRVPYHVCGGLQDNGVWCGPSRTRERSGVTAADWYTVYGGDGFHSAVSADSPRIRYAEYQFGNVGRTDVDTWHTESVKPIAEDAGAESGYAFRWDWDTPFLISSHDPTVLYLGGNHLFRLTGRGRDWEILGPDMTRANRFHPEPDSGHTSYHSLHSVAESALDGHVLWTGSNDGLLWVSTDAGRTWRNVTSNLPGGGPTPPCWVSEIEPSHFDASTAFVTYDCHRRDDYAPYVFRTKDAGKTWTEITGDLPEGGSSFVVRQDPVNRDLLFVGTHDGVYVSIRGGGHWARLGGNLPTTEVRDLAIVPRRKELVVGSFGRGIYILDIAALEQATPAIFGDSVRLFDPPPARQFEQMDTYGSPGDAFFHAGATPPEAAITYWVGQDLGKDVKVEISRVSDDTTGTAGGAAAGGGGAAAGGGSAAAGTDTAGGSGEGGGETIRTLTGPGTPGFHVLAWNLEREDPRPREKGGPTSPSELRRVLPGTFRVKLEAGGTTEETTLVVRGGWPHRSSGRVR